MKKYLLTTAFVAFTHVAIAQTAAPAITNPLRPAAPVARVNPPAQAPAVKVETPAEKVAKPKRARSEKQLANDNIMRKCGAEWRADKAAGKTGSTTWRTYLGDCRKKNKPA